MKQERILMPKVSKIKKEGKDQKVFQELKKGFQAFSKADFYIIGYKKENEILVYKIPSKEFYKLSKDLLYLNNSSDSYRTLSLRLHRYAGNRVELIEKFYLESFNADKLKAYKGNEGRKFEAFIEDRYHLIHNEKDAIQYGGVDSKKDNVNYQIKLEAASMKMFREWYECNDLFYENGWV